MKGNIKLVPMYIKNNFLNKLNHNVIGFTLLEVIVTIVILEIFLAISFSYIRYSIIFFNTEEAKILNLEQEKIAFEYMVMDLISADEILVNEDIIKFSGFYNDEKKRSNITYKLYKSDKKMVLGRKKDGHKNIMPVINNVSNLCCNKVDDLLFIELEVKDNLGKKKKIVHSIVPRLKSWEGIK